jgi:hypothetical protein
MKMPYRYALIKFMPFPETGEFANIGIIAINPKTAEFTYKLEVTKTKRTMEFFQLNDRKLYKDSVARLRTELEAIKEQVKARRLDAIAAFNLLVHPYQNLIQFSKARSGLASYTNLQVMTDKLFGEYVDFTHAKKESAQQLLTERVSKYIATLDLENPFYKKELGPAIYSLPFPLVQDNKGKVRIIKPIYLGGDISKIIIERTDKFLSELKRLKEFDAYPEEILVTFDKGEGVSSIIEEVQERALKDLSRKCDIASFDSKAEIVRFAKA